jgi:preprotein translocase subunit SecE
MNKVTWPSRKELVRSAIVVLVTIFLLAMILFLYDLFWRWFLMDFLNIDGNKRLP